MREEIIRDPLNNGIRGVVFGTRPQRDVPPGDDVQELAKMIPELQPRHARRYGAHQRFP